MEQRAYPRRPIVTLCRISRAGSQACEGSTENISRNGIMLQLPSRDFHQEPLQSGLISEEKAKINALCKYLKPKVDTDNVTVM